MENHKNHTSLTGEEVEARYVMNRNQTLDALLKKTEKFRGGDGRSFLQSFYASLTATLQLYACSVFLNGFHFLS
jgi:hypothetical protein